MKLFIKCNHCTTKNRLKELSFNMYQESGLSKITKPICCKNCKKDIDLKSRYLTYSNWYLNLIIFLSSVLILVFLWYLILNYYKLYTLSVMRYMYIVLPFSLYISAIFFVVRIKQANFEIFNTVKYHWKRIEEPFTGNRK